jgi:hypothetical protein
VGKVYSVKLRFWFEGVDPSAVFEPECLDEPEGVVVSINDRPFRCPTLSVWEINAWLEDNGLKLKKTTLGNRVNHPGWRGQYTLTYG